MNKSYNKFLIITSLALLVGGVYSYFSNSLYVQALDTPVSANSSLVSQNGSSSSVLGINNEDKIAEDTAFLATLTSLKKIKIDTTIFNSQEFLSLNDNTVNLEAAVPGRPNPFAPFSSEVSSSNSALSPVVTNDPTQVTDKSAILNGTINNLSGVTSVFFEYGADPELGQSTSPVKQSLVGTFVTSIKGLTPETTYFYRAVAKVGTAPIYGDVVSFNTN